MTESSVVFRIPITMPIAISVALIGCGPPDPTSSENSGRDVFMTRAWPALGRCVGCHGVQQGIAFLAPGTAEGAYSTLLAYQPPVVDMTAPEASPVLKKGPHAGPALMPSESEALLAWLAAERADRERGLEPDMMVAFGPVVPKLGAVNSVDLGRGATLRFVPSAGGAGLALRQITLTAGTAKLHVVHPLLVTHPPVVPPRIDASDAFGDVDLELAPGQSALLGGGSAAFPTFDPADPIMVHFRTLEMP